MDEGRAAKKNREDGVEEESKNPFNPFASLHPKLELDDPLAPPTGPAVAAARSKFEPKFKPRVSAAGGGRTRPSSSASAVKAELPPTGKPPRANNTTSARADSLAAKSKAKVVKQEVDMKPKLELPPPEHEKVRTSKPLNDAHMGNDENSGDNDTGVKCEEVSKMDTDMEDVATQEEVPSEVEVVGLQEGEEDTIVREIDVFINPTVDQDTNLYVLQYPLRPHWRPYGLDERCQEVRVKPKQSKLEVDLVVETEGDNYDRNAPDYLQIKKQTLSSSRTGSTESYAIGVLRGNKLHLNLLQAVVQLRPSMKYLDDADAQKKATNQSIDKDEEMGEADDEEGASEAKEQLLAVKVEVKKQETERQEQMRLQSHAYLKQLEEAESWIPLEPHGVDSPVTEGVRKNMLREEDSEIAFNMSRMEYINVLTPGRASNNAFEAATRSNMNEELSKSLLDTLPLEQRFEKVLTQGKVQVLQFDRLMKLAPPGCKEEEVIAVLQEFAYLVQGCWVVASSLRYSGPICIVRDYIVSLFTRGRVIPHQHLQELQVPKEMVREVLLPLAIQRPALAGWEFQEPTDLLFMKRYPSVAQEQSERWLENEKPIKVAALGLRLGNEERTSELSASKIEEMVTRNSSQSQAGGKVPVLKKASTDGAHGLTKASTGNTGFSGEWTMSKETRAALPGALKEIFMKHHVCSLQFICEKLREMAITKAATPNANHRVVAAAVAAAKGANAPVPEFTAALSESASNIDGLYFLKSLGNPAMDPFRDVIIALLRARGPQTGLRKVDIVEASKIALQTEIQSVVYQKVLRELCYTKGGAWVMKAGDGRPA